MPDYSREKLIKKLREWTSRNLVTMVNERILSILGEGRQIVANDHVSGKSLARIVWIIVCGFLMVCSVDSSSWRTCTWASVSALVQHCLVSHFVGTNAITGKKLDESATSGAMEFAGR